MSAFSSCGKRGKDGSVSGLAYSRSSGDQNTPLSTAARFPVCRHPFMAGIRHKYFLQIFILYYIARDVHGPRVSVREPTAAASAVGVSVFHRAPLRLHSSATTRTQLSEAHIFFCFVLPRKMTGWLIWRETLCSLPRSLLWAGRGEKVERSDGGLSEWFGKTPADESLLVRVPEISHDAECCRGWGCAALIVHTRWTFWRLHLQKVKKSVFFLLF